MGEVKWTNEQQRVINHRKGNLLVAAAAGSGKTAVLVERIIQMLMDEENPMSIDELLVVTFTNLAAGEMKERIQEALSRKLEENPEDKRIRKQLNLLNHASINTIHSFCLDVIRRNFHQLDLDPNFRVADETEILLLQSDVLGEVLEEFYTEGKDCFFDLVESYGGIKYDTPLEGYILNLHSFIQSYPWPYKWLDEQVEQFHVQSLDELADTPWIHVLMEEAELMITGMEEATVKAIQICQLPGGPAVYEATLNEDLEMIRSLKEAHKDSFIALEKQMRNTVFSRMKACRSKEVEEDLKEQCKTIRSKQIQDVFKDLNNNTFFKAPEELLEDLNNLYPTLKMLVTVVKAFHERYQEAKKEKGLIDYSDIEHMALGILVTVDGDKVEPTKEALALQDKYSEILIDEYQDSNLVQEIILTSISREARQEPNIFMVGDVKQSIYRFRMARPDLFVNKYESYDLTDEALYKRIDLYKNFRSREEVLEGVNYIFKYAMNKEIGEIVYDDLASLHVGASFAEQELGVAGGPIEVDLVDVQLPEHMEEAPEFEELRRLKAVDIEAAMVADKIQYVMDPANKVVVYDKHEGEYRSPRFEDIVILMRATSSRADVFLDTLIGRGIPAYAESNGGYFDALEVKTLLALLKIIDNPMQDIPLITVLRSPIVGLTVDELTTIRLQLNEGSYYDALVCYAEGELLETELGRKLHHFNEQLKLWRKESIHSNLHDFIWKLYLETDYYYYVSTMPGGQQRKANLDALLDKAVKFEKGSYRGLFNFIRVMEKIKRNQGDFGSAKTLGPNENIVRIMSIHKSKGLEFPITIVSGMSKTFNRMDLNKKIILHQDLGFGTEYINHMERYSTKTVAKAAINRQIKKENLSEEMRILYVALTRAKEKLILTGTVSNLEKRIKEWAMDTDRQGYLPSYRSIHAKNYLDWLMPLLLRHEDGQSLRERGEIRLTAIEDPSSWQVNIHGLEDVIQLQEPIEDDDDMTSEELEMAMAERLNWTYEKDYLSKIPLKLTVSDIKRQSMDESSMEKFFAKKLEDDDYKRPAFIEGERELTPAERGTLYHKVMYHIDMTDIDSEEAIQAQLNELLKRNVLTTEDIDIIPLNMIYNFGQTNICQRMNRADRIYKEKPFVIGIEANKIYDIPDEDLVLVQGVIDCFFEENNEMILLDYKTDKEDDLKKLAKRYKKQMELYSIAISRYTGKKVNKIYLYSTFHGKTVPVYI